ALSESPVSPFPQENRRWPPARIFPRASGLTVDKKPKPSISPISDESEKPSSSAGQSLTDVANPALGEIYQRLYPEMRTHRPRQEAIRAALRAMKQLSPEMYAEQSAEGAALEVNEAAGENCRVCGHHNREGNRFCSKCG